MLTLIRALLPPMLLGGGWSGTSLAESQRVKKNLGWFALSEGLRYTRFILGGKARRVAILRKADSAIDGVHMGIVTRRTFAYDLSTTTRGFYHVMINADRVTRPAPRRQFTIEFS